MQLRNGVTPSFKPTVTVGEFLMSLYASKHHDLVQKIPKKLLDACMNFTHFVSTRENLYSAVIPELCHDLLRRSAALQLAPLQPTYDKLIPIYFGREDEHFDPSRCGVIMTQDKKQGRCNTG